MVNDIKLEDEQNNHTDPETGKEAPGVGEQGSGERNPEVPPAEAGEPVPVYLLDEPPPKAQKGDYIRWGLLHGLTKEELVADGFNGRSVDNYSYELEKANLWHRPPRQPAREREKAGLPATTERGIQVHARGASPEELINSISVPMDGPETKTFEKGMKFGMSVLILGVRAAQELTNMGVQQARPIIEMARDMRMGEAAAAKSAAGEAASLAAAEVQQNMAPFLMKIAEMGKVGGEADPMKSMMVRTMEPMIQRLMAQFMPGMAGQQTPTGWTRKKE